METNRMSGVTVVSVRRQVPGNTRNNKLALQLAAIKQADSAMSAWRALEKALAQFNRPMLARRQIKVCLLPRVNAPKDGSLTEFGGAQSNGSKWLD